MVRFGNNVFGDYLLWLNRDKYPLRSELNHNSAILFMKKISVIVIM